MDRLLTPPTVNQGLDGLGISLQNKNLRDLGPSRKLYPSQWPFDRHFFTPEKVTLKKNNKKKHKRKNLALICMVDTCS